MPGRGFGAISFLMNDLFFCWGGCQIAYPCNLCCIIETEVAEYNYQLGSDHPGEVVPLIMFRA